MEKRQVAPGCGVFFDGEWQVSNLKFLTEFMRMLGLSTGDLAKAVSLCRQSVTRWFVIDSAYLSKVITIADYYGYDFRISYIVPQKEIERTRLSIETPEPRKKEQPARLDFLREAMRTNGISNERLAQSLKLQRNSIQRWIRNDDITFDYIYRIAEVWGWKVDIKFKLKEKPVK